MKYVTLLLTIFFSSVTFYIQAQHRNDYNWMIGYGILLPDQKQGGTRLDFSTDPLTQTYYDVSVISNLSNATISDSAGVLQFYTNGCQVFDTTHQIMQGGDSINYANSYIYRGWCESGLGYHAINGLMIVPVPNAPKKYMIFQAWYGESDPYKLTYPVALLYTLVDMDQNNGLGAVVAKNQVVFQDTIGDMMAIVKHGNGRDWWIVNPSTNSDQMILTLLTPEGIKGPFYQSTSVHWPVNYANFQMSGGVFSPDGRKYAKVSTRHELDALAKVQVFDFDRCKGTFSNPKTYEFPYITNGEIISVMDVAFSPNSQFIYVTTGVEIYQFDTFGQNLEDTKVLVGVYDGFMAPLWATLYQLQLAPNGKIYVCASNGSHVLHTIHYPDKKGEACQFINHDVELLTKNGQTMPNFPNFRLYNWADSPCDTIGKPPVIICDSGDESIGISPNPVSQTTLVTVLSCKNGTVTVFDAIGRLVYEQKEALSGQDYELDVSDWPAGVYFAVVRDGTRVKVRASRLVVVH